MNIKNYLLVTALMFSPLMMQPADTPNAPETEIVEPKKDIPSMYVTSLIIGGLIGCTTGALFTGFFNALWKPLSIKLEKNQTLFDNRKIDKRTFDQDKDKLMSQFLKYCIILGIIEIYTRKTIVDVIEDIFSKCRITNSRKLMVITAWFASWKVFITYAK